MLLHARSGAWFTPGLTRTIYAATLGRPVTAIAPLGAVTAKTCDNRFGIASLMDPNGKLTGFTYDPDSNLPRLTDPRDCQCRSIGRHRTELPASRNATMSDDLTTVETRYQQTFQMAGLAIEPELAGAQHPFQFENQ